MPARGRVIATSTIIRDEELEQIAAALYDNRLPYHNFQHALANVEASQLLIGRCSGEGVSVDGAVIYLASLFHDAGYQDDHRARGFDCKEAWSAELARIALGRRGDQPARIEAVQAAILSTACGVSCQTVEAKIVKAADLSGLALDYERFLCNAKRLWREHILLTGDDVSWLHWREQAVRVIQQYMVEDLGVSAACYAEEGETWLARSARANSERLRTSIVT